MPSSISNTVAQPGLVSTNPFLSTAPKTGGSTTSAFSPTQNGGVSTGYSPAPTTTGFSSSPTGGIIPTNSTTSQSQPGIIPLSNTGTQGGTGNSIYQTNLNNAGVSSIPAGYSFNANGQLVNNQGQQYQAPTNNSTDNTNPTTGSTGTSGVNSTFPGLVSSLATTASQPSSIYTQNQNTSGQVQNGLINLQDPNSQLNQPVTADTNALNELQQNYATQQGIIGNSPIGLSEQGGEQGLLNSQYASKLGAAQTALNTATTNRQQQIGALESAGGLANTAASNATSQQGTQQSGTATAAGLAQPSLAAPGQSYANPQTGQFGNIAGEQSGGGGLTGIGNLQSQIQAGQTYGTNNAILGKVQAQLPALQQAITADNFNPSSVTGLNQITQWAQGNLSNSAIPEIQGSLNDIVGGLSQVLGVPSSGGSDFRLQFAGSIVSALQKGSSIQDALNFAVSQAIAGNQGYLQGSQQSNTNSTGYTPFFGNQ